MQGSTSISPIAPSVTLVNSNFRVTQSTCLNIYFTITNLMELSPSQEAASCAATQEFPNVLWNQKFITAFTRALHWSLS
jgi:hypothetical protein